MELQSTAVAKSNIKHIRGSARKARLVADMIRGKNVLYAMELLKFTPKRAAQDLLKAVKSALANAQEILKTDGSDLIVSKILINEGLKMKRWRPGARGRYKPYKKYTYHVYVELDRGEDSKIDSNSKK